MKSVLTVVALLLFTQLALSQDSLVLVKELQFSTPFEKQVVEDYLQHGKPDYYSLFVSNGRLLTDAQISQQRTRLESYIKGLADEKFQAKKNDKKAKFVYDEVHKTFFQKYELENHFEDIFYNGTYNCVSASALYGIIFEKLGIPYVIKEEPTHVFLIAYPDAEQIMIETTTPTGGVYTMTTGFKQNYVRVLKEQKIIGANEYASRNVDDLFDQYYFGKQENISLINLVGLQYLNDAVYNLDKKQFETALAQLEKSYLFYPSDRCGYLIMVCAAQVLSDHPKKDLKHAALISKLARFKRYGVTADVIKAEFYQVTNEYLVVNNNIPALEEYYNYLQDNLRDSTLKKEIEYYYYYERGRFQYNRGHYDVALPYLERTVQLQPNSEEANTILMSALGQHLEGQSDLPLVIKTFKEYAEKYPTLENNNKFRVMYASVLLVQFGREFSLNKAAEGEKFRADFESYRKKFPDTILNSDLIGQSYSTAAVYYFRKGQTAKAKAIIAKGLEYAPGNFELEMRKQMIK